MFSQSNAPYLYVCALYVPSGNIDVARTLFNQAVALAKTEVEMAHLFSLINAAEAQIQAQERVRALGVDLTI